MLKICQTFVDLFAAGGGPLSNLVNKGRSCLLRQCTKHDSKKYFVLYDLRPRELLVQSSYSYPIVPMTPIGLTLRTSTCFNSRSAHSLPHSLFSSFILSQILRIWRAGLRPFSSLLKLIHFVRNRL